MKLAHLFENWNLKGLKIKAAFLEMEWSPKDADKDAAWELYVELLTRITTQALDAQSGTEESALDSVHSIFKTTRDVLKHQGRDCIQFSKIAIVIVNQIIRPFTSKWHRVVELDQMDDSRRIEFRNDLRDLQIKLISYTHMLSEIAGVEDITELES